MADDKVSREDLRARLTPEQYAVTQEGATERAYTGALLHNKDAGMYSCVVCDTDLFSSEAKYDSGSGWPSFWTALAGDRVETRVDVSHGMRREEIVCAKCGAHLGHVFEDGPQPSGMRYCVNSASLGFKPGDDT